MILVQSVPCKANIPGMDFGDISRNRLSAQNCPGGIDIAIREPQIVEDLPISQSEL